MHRHLPFGADIVPSPVIRTVAAIVEDPPGKEEGGKTRTWVSGTCLAGGLDPVSANCDVCISGSIEKQMGWSMIATHRATEIIDWAEGEMDFTF
jgi:hypothetical protein